MSVEQDARLLALVGCVRGIVLELDAQARYVNAWADDVALLARPPGEMIGRTIDEVLGAEAGAPFTALVHRVYATGSVEHLEYPLDLPGGRRWFFADIKRVGSPEAGMTVVFFARDITERKAGELALASSEERYRLATRATNDMLWDWDITTGAVTWGGEHAGQCDGTTASWLARVHPEDVARIQRELDAALAGRDLVWCGGYRWRRFDDSYGDFIDRACIVRDADGRPLRMVGSQSDVSERNRLQAQLVQADRLAGLGLLAAGVGHEINNPLTYVSGNLSLALELLGEHPDPELAQLLAEAQQGAARIADIVKSLKTLSRPEDATPAPIAVASVVEQALRIADNEIKHRARVVRDLRSVPPVLAREPQLMQVFLNVLINAAHAIETGAVESNEIRVATSLDASGRVVVTIDDTGCGIPADQLGRVFDPFFTTKPVGVGTGLGLSISHGIVTGLGGQISIASTEGRGTSVSIALPAVSERKARVLVIDDERSVGQLIRRVLRDADVVALTDAREALDQLDDGFDLILCDVMMPQMSGMEFYESLRASRTVLLSRVWFMTGGAFTPRTQAFLALVNGHLLDKPLDPGRLRALLRTEVSRARPAPGA